jgi:hypothetical protein
MDEQSAPQENTTSPQPSTPSPMIPQSFGWARTVGISLGVLTLGLAIAFGGFYLAQQNKNAPNPTPATSITAPTSVFVSPTTSAPQQLTYRDETLGVYFSYPATWEVNHVQSLDGYWLQLKRKDQTYKGYYTGPILLAIAKADTTPLNIQRFLQGGPSSTTTSITIAGQQGYLMTNANCEPYMCDRYVAVAHNNTAYLLKSFAPTPTTPAPSDQKEVFDLFVQSFTFIK